MLNLREAAEQAGTSKTSIFRAIKSGRLSATRDDQGGVQIDPAELARAFPPKPLRPERSSNETPEQGVMPTEPSVLRERNAALEAEVRLLRQMLDDMKGERSDLKAERDRWAAQAERLALAPPPAMPEPLQPQSRGWWPFRRAS